MKTIFAISLVAYAAALAVVAFGRGGELSLSTLAQSPFGWGLAASLLLSYLFVGSNGFIGVLKHELAHAVAAVLTFNRPVGLHVNTDGSGLHEYRGRANWFIHLAPYFLPLLTLPLLVLGWVGIAGGIWYQALLGVAAGVDLVIAGKQVSYSQPDLLRVGKVRSTLLIGASAMICWIHVGLFGLRESLPRVAETYVTAGRSLWATTVAAAGAVRSMW